MEVRNLRLCDLDFDRKQLKVVQEKAKRPLFATFGAFDSGIKKYIEAEKPENYLFGMPREGRAGASTCSAQASIPDIRNGAFNGR